MIAHNAVTQKSDHYQNLLASTRDKSAKDKDALKKATRIQRERAQRQEELNTELQGQISDLIFQVFFHVFLHRQVIKFQKTQKPDEHSYY